MIFLDKDTIEMLEREYIRIHGKKMPKSYITKFTFDVGHKVYYYRNKMYKEVLDLVVKYITEMGEYK